MHRPLRLIGMIFDGDRRRLFERDGPHALERTAGEIMNRNARTIDGAAFATAALALMEERKITSLIVTGVIHIHDLWTPGLI